MDNPVGRPTVMTPETIQKLEGAFLIGCSDLEACLIADIAKTTLYNYQVENPEFVERKERLKETPAFTARTTLVKEVATNAELALKYLERKKKDEFGTRQEIANPPGESFKTDNTIEIIHRKADANRDTGEAGVSI
jgi:hypothetical protein